MAFKMKGFSPFTAKTAEMEVAGIERKQARIDRKAAKGKDVSRKQERLDKESQRIYDREIKRAERKERKADKKEAKGNTGAASRKRRKATKIREAASPLAKKSKAQMQMMDHGMAASVGSPMMKKSAYKKDKKSPHEQFLALKNKIDNKTATKSDIRKFKRLQEKMGKGIGKGNYDEVD